VFARKDLNLEWLEIAGVTPDLIRGRNDGFWSAQVISLQLLKRIDEFLRGE